MDDPGQANTHESSSLVDCKLHKKYPELEYILNAGI